MSDSSPIAHEGNPKEDSITISGGSVLSTATLTIEAPFVPAPPPTVPPPLEDAPDSDVSCSDVFAWNDGQTSFAWGPEPCNTSSGDIIRSFDTTGIIRITTTPACYGIHRAQIPGLSDSPELFSFSCSFKSLEFGTPIAGPCFMAARNSTFSEATCYAIVVDWSTGITSFVKWTNASLSSIAFGSILYQAAYLPTGEEYFYLASEQGVFGPSMTAKIYPEGSFGSGLLWGTDIVTETTTNISDAGFVAIGGPGSNGRCYFGHSTLTTCHNSLTMFGFNDVESL